MHNKDKQLKLENHEDERCDIYEIGHTAMFHTILSFCSMLAQDFSCAMLGKFVQC